MTPEENDRLWRIVVKAHQEWMNRAVSLLLAGDVKRAIILLRGALTSEFENTFIKAKK